jgi:cell fate regulator YaaT (PSP1 superfamily)
MTEFRPISIKMAKQQNLPLSPMEISGVCGRLLCCLAYENDFYGEVKKRLPRKGSTVQTPQGVGKVISVNVLQESVEVKLENEVTGTFTLEELESPPKSPERPSRKRGRHRRR